MNEEREDTAGSKTEPIIRQPAQSRNPLATGSLVVACGALGLLCASWYVLPKCWLAPLPAALCCCAALIGIATVVCGHVARSSGPSARRACVAVVLGYLCLGGALINAVLLKTQPTRHDRICKRNMRSMPVCAVADCGCPWHTIDYFLTADHVAVFMSKKMPVCPCAKGENYIYKGHEMYCPVARKHPSHFSELGNITDICSHLATNAVNFLNTIVDNPEEWMYLSCAVAIDNRTNLDDYVDRLYDGFKNYGEPDVALAARVKDALLRNRTERLKHIVASYAASNLTIEQCVMLEPAYVRLGDRDSVRRILNTLHGLAFKTGTPAMVTSADSRDVGTYGPLLLRLLDTEGQRGNTDAARDAKRLREAWVAEPAVPEDIRYAIRRQLDGYCKEK